MPRDLFQHLRKVHVANKQLNISEYNDSPKQNKPNFKDRKPRKPSGGDRGKKKTRSFAKKSKS
jgi:hypothetical protein